MPTNHAGRTGSAVASPRETGLAMTVTGKNDHAVEVENWGPLALEHPSKDLTACCV